MPAQQASAPQTRLVDQQKGALKINVIEGEGARNNIRSRTAVAPTVEVKDATDKPVAGAEVVFQLPLVGPSGAFNGWLRSQTVRTDEQGRATVNGYAPNSEAGRFNIKVSATAGTQTGQAIIAQSNVLEGSSAASGKKKTNKWIWVAVIGGAAIAGGAAAKASGGNGTTTTAATKVPVTIAAGAVTVGVPR